MRDFVFEVPTKIIFGGGKVAMIGAELGAFGIKKPLLVYGKGSIERNGVYKQVISSLEKQKITPVEFRGIRPNPVLSHVYRGIELARREEVDGILAVGGGSVIDSAKAIACGSKANGDVWDFFIHKAQVKDALPIFCVLTVAASASEMNGAAVITNENKAQKFSIRSPLLLPKVSILDPTTLFTLPAEYTANSAIDIITHMLEGYFNNSASYSPLQDGLIHALSKVVIQATEKLLVEPYNYDERANFMWAATLGFNGITNVGMGAIAFPVHMIEHSLSALYDIAHGAGLAIILPAWMRYFLEEKASRFALWGREVFEVQDAAACVEALCSWFSRIGAPVSLEEAGIPVAAIPRIAANAHELARVWSLKDYNQQNIASILRLAAH